MKGRLVFVLLICAFIYGPMRSAQAAVISTVAWEDISDKDISPDGRAALGLGSISSVWRHAETEHFVYHFTDEKESETIYVHAESYYKWIKDFFGVVKDGWAKKSHVFIFTDEKAWNEFRSRTRLVPQGEAFTTGWELFILRKPYWLSPRRSLAHELTHIILFRFLDGPIPLFLNEGFAEFVSCKVLAMQLDRTEFDIRPLQLVSKDDYIPLGELIALDSYPKDRVETFYGESELLVRFLVDNYKREQFYELLRAVSRGGNFARSLKDICGAGIEEIEEKFKAYALEKESTGY